MRLMRWRLTIAIVFLRAAGCGGSWSAPGGGGSRQGAATGGRPQLSVSGALKWKIPVSPSGRVSGPSSSNDDRFVFVHSRGNLLAYDASTGVLKWSVLVANFGAVSAPTVAPDASAVFVLTEQGGLLQAFAVESGAQLWSYEFFSGRPFNLAGWSPAISQDSKMIYVSTPRDFVLHAVDVVNGTSTWVSRTRTAEDSMLSSPPSVSPDGSTVFVVNTHPDIEDPRKGDSWLVAVDAIDGAMKWWYTPTLANWMGPYPVVAPDGLAVYVSTKNDILYAIDAVNGSVLWDFPGIPSLSAVALSPDGQVVYAPGRHALHALAALDGSQLWNHTPTNFARGLDVYTRLASHLTEASISGDGATVYVGTRGVYDHVGDNIFYDFNQVIALRASDGRRKWAYPETPGTGAYLPDGQYLDSLTYIGISGEGSTLFTLETESFVSAVWRKWAQPVFLHAIDITACDLTPVLPSGAGVGTCSDGLARGESCVPECPAGYGLPTGSVTCSGGMVTSTFACSPNACETSGALPANGGIGNCSGILASGSNCTPSCDDGYYHSGNVTCWLGVLRSTFECLPLPCDPRPLAKLHESYGNCGAVLLSGSSCQPGCPRGSGPFGGLNCTAGVLDEDFECVEGYCAVQVPENGALGSCDTALRVGRLCKIGCAPGYSPGPGNASSVTCTELGLAGRGIGLVCVENDCHAEDWLPSSDGAPAKYGAAFGPGNCTAQMAAGTSCEPSCAAGLVPVGTVRCSLGVVKSDFECKLVASGSDVADEAPTTTLLSGASPEDLSTTTGDAPKDRLAILEYSGAPEDGRRWRRLAALLIFAAAVA